MNSDTPPPCYLANGARQKSAVKFCYCPQCDPVGTPYISSPDDCATHTEDKDDWFVQGCKIVAYGAAIVLVVTTIAALLSLFSPRSN